MGVNGVICSPIALSSDQGGETHLRKVDLIGVINLIDAAKDADVLRFVYISLSNNLDLSFPPGKGKQVIEQRLFESGIPYTILHAGDYQSQVFGAGTQPISWISIKDLARLATQSLENPAQRNAVVELGGPTVPGPHYKTALEAVTGKRV